VLNLEEKQMFIFVCADTKSHKIIPSRHYRFRKPLRNITQQFCQRVLTVLRTIPLFGLGLVAACGSVEETAGLITGVTALGAQAPSSEIQQTYYLGVFDPQEQLQPTVYRVRVHGQASFLSFAHFASGWVPAEVTDTLSTSFTFDKGNKRFAVNKPDDVDASFKTGRRLIIFGPEGFRESPANYRLAIAMGTSPETYFSAINEALGSIAFAKQGSANDLTLQRDLFEALEVIDDEQKRLTRLEKQAGSAGEIQ
jgi:hypothetical protein